MLTQQHTDSRKTRRLASCAMLTSLALIFSYIEFLIPFNFGAPGVKLGLANIVVVICIYKMPAKYGLVINIARICLAALLFGSMFSAAYALAGGLVSLGIMLLLKKTDLFSIIGVSMAGGASHNIAQMLTAMLLMETKGILAYGPVLLLSGMATGIINGLITALVLKAIGKQTM